MTVTQGTSSPEIDEQLRRVRRLCLALPDTTEKSSHGEPTFFVKKKVFTMFAGNHHNDGHLAVWIPVPEGHQAALIAANPEIYFRPPYVGVKGWVGIELSNIDDDQLGSHLTDAWKMIASAKRR
ncbi:MAG TPA: MmcQ/YjbR family DNA-binding protein [Bryobacteraceae bacterium]|nr:MmcQ/YjbR family DNA-binding protein [Bryobacteraceae bacterium]